jgi:uncharacterized protein (TIGR01777 family)
MRILISGASGFIGTPLSSYFRTRGHEVTALSRHELKIPEGYEVVIHLAGEPLTLSRWSEEKKKKIFESRKFGTQHLCHLLAHAKQPPKLFLSASAIGFYGNRGEELLTEESGKGRGFLSDVCKAWEEASFALEQKGVRTIHARFGMVLGPDGGSMKKMLPLYKLGLGAVLGTGEQWISWIALNDLISAIDYCIHSSLQGAVNFVSPDPVRQAEFSQTLAKLLHRPHFLKIPAGWLRFLLGSVANELLLSSTKVNPSKLLATNFSFDYPDLHSALSKAI